MQPLQPAYEAIMDASDQLGRTLHNLLAGDERGHVPEQLTELDAAVESLTAARCDLGANLQFCLLSAESSVSSMEFSQAASLLFTGWGYERQTEFDSLHLLLTTNKMD
jgi:hypothetical protein